MSGEHAIIREPITLATKVTLIRIMGVPVFILIMVYYNMNLREGGSLEVLRLAALGLFVAIALTDALDGYLARSRNEVTRLGQMLDPVADKMLMLSSVVLLTRSFPEGTLQSFPVWFALLVISRDVLLTGGALLLHHFCRQLEVRPRFTGKVATCSLMVLIVWVLGKGPALGTMLLLTVSALFTAVSGIQYLVDGIRQYEEVHRNDG